MQLNSKAAVMLAVTFVLGIAVGAFALGALREPPEREDDAPARAEKGPGDSAQQAPRPREGRDSRFVSEMMRFLAPVDDAQREKLRPHLLAADSANSIYVKSARDSMAVVIKRMREGVAPLLDKDQLARLDAWVAQPWDNRQPRGAKGERRREDGPKPPGDPLRKQNDE
jgi:hypothetical protein